MIKDDGGGCFVPYINVHPVNIKAGVINTSHSNQIGVWVILATLRCTIR
jgi:hypothetical protein